MSATPRRFSKANEVQATARALAIDFDSNTGLTFRQCSHGVPSYWIGSARNQSGRHTGAAQRPIALVVNLRTAKVLSLNFPPNLLARADQVIE
jgi:hypothetical protein